MKILHIMNAASGGSALSTLELAAALRKYGVESHAVCHNMGTCEEKSKVRSALQNRVLFTNLYWWNKKIRVKLWKRPFIEALQLIKTQFLIGSCQRIENYCQQHKIDLIHTNTSLTPEGGIVAKKMKLPHVWHIRELIGPGQPFRFWQGDRRVIRFIENHADLIIANSDYTLSLIQPYGYLDKWKVIYNGLELSPFLKVSPKTCGSSSKMIIGMIGSLTSRLKRHDFFIEVAENIKNRNGVFFKIFGQLPPKGKDAYADQIRRRIEKMDLIDFVTLEGHKPAAQIMEEIDILFHPASQESFGRIIVEAMASGKAIVGINDGGVSNILRHQETGLLFRKDDLRGIAAGLTGLIENSAMREKLGSQARKDSQERFNLEKCADSIYECYQNLMKAA